VVALERAESLAGVAKTPANRKQVSLPDLPPGNNGAEIQFLAVSTARAHNIPYQYRLNGGKEPWGTPTGGITITYSNLRPGTYSFEVRSLTMFV